MIPIQNIYYMLSYAFRTLTKQGYREMSTEKFSNTADLMTEILIAGISQQLKRGLGRAYIEQMEDIPVIRGRVNITESVKRQTMINRKLSCVYDDFSVNNSKNRIIKSTALLLLRADVAKQRKSRLRKLLVYFDKVELIDLRTVDWNIHYDRNNQTYRMLISICYLVEKGLLQTQADGKTKIMDFLDDQQMYHLYEKFILEYYKKEYPYITTNASKIKWQLDDGMDYMLPNLLSDITLEYDNKVLIIDAKYYSHIMQNRYEKETIRSANMFQIFTYVKNKEAELKDKPHEVAGMLLYAQTDNGTQPDCCYQMSGNMISVKTLNLNCDFEDIRRQLDSIITDYFKL
ncbi:MAG: 5-methylcytosine-specific restriction endonuclease system specificity protein McrC [Clostridiales bacterium]|nr:5-methylcytosine-specific restriction endonuclease system specificity protein McrC [Clostridiales bacterium]